MKLVRQKCIGFWTGTGHWMLALSLVLTLVFSGGCDISPVPTPIPYEEGEEDFELLDEENAMGADFEDPLRAGGPEGQNAPTVDLEGGEFAEEGGEEDESGGNISEAIEGGESSEPSEGGSIGGGLDEGGEAAEEGGGEEGGGEGNTDFPSDVCGGDEADGDASDFPDFDAGSLENDGASDDEDDAGCE